MTLIEELDKVMKVEDTLYIDLLEKDIAKWEVRFAEAMFSNNIEVAKTYKNVLEALDCDLFICKEKFKETYGKNTAHITLFKKD